MQSIDATLKKPSQEKPWLKFFSEEAKKAVLPQKTIYEYIKEQNEGCDFNVALNYFGNRINYGRLFYEIDRAAGAFSTFGVKKGDLVCCCSVTIPEMVYALYGLNKIGAAPLMLDPRISAEGAKKFLIESGSKILVMMDLCFERLSCLIDELELEKVIINVGCGDAKDNAKVIDAAINDLGKITGQKAVPCRAKKSVANFKLRVGMPIGVKVTLRGERMYEFIDRLFNTALPRVRDFRGINPDAFDGRGNYAMGVKEQLIFPEIEYDKIDRVRGMDIVFVTTAKTDEEAKELLALIGVPFVK